MKGFNEREAAGAIDSQIHHRKRRKTRKRKVNANRDWRESEKGTGDCPNELGEGKNTKTEWNQGRSHPS